MDPSMVLGGINCNLFLPFLLLIPFLFLILKKKSLKTAPLPPGPNSLPILGNILQISGKKPHVILTNLAKIHGSLMSLKLGTQTIIVGSSPAVASEILRTNDRALSGRFVSHANPFKSKQLNHLSFVFATECTDQWKYLRTLCRTEVFSNKALEYQLKLREKAVREMVEFLYLKEGQIVDVGEVVFAAIFNSLSNTFFSTSFMEFGGNSRGGQMKELTRQSVELMSAPNVSDFFPILSGLDVQGIHKKCVKSHNETYTIWEDVIEERRKQRSSDVSRQRDFLDVLFETGFDNVQINQLILELYTAGTGTSSSTIEWLIACLVKNPDAMQKLRDELAQTVGKDIVQESHLPNLPYLQACVKETLRLYPPGPFLLPHRAVETCQVMGYTIPKDAQILVNTWAIGRDPATWDDPLSFKPERFLNSTMDFRGNAFEFTPFSAGRRICPGLPIAVRQVSLIAGSLVHLFDWSLPGNKDPSELDMNDKLAITLQMEQPLLLIPKARK